MTTVVSKIQRKREKLENKINAELAAAQKKCKHKVVAHWDGHWTHSLTYPKRVCMECGLEEVGGWWCYSIECSHWHPKEGFATPILGPKEGRVFVAKTFDEIMKLRA